MAQLRSADRVRKCLLIRVDRTYRRHHETDASDPKRTCEVQFPSIRLDLSGTALLRHARIHRAFLVGAHQPQITDDIGRKDRSESTDRACYSGKPAWRRPVVYLAQSSGRRKGTTFARIDTRKSGSICRMNAMNFLASGSRPARP
jgi:hypothetical protein